MYEAAQRRLFEAFNTELKKGAAHWATIHLFGEPEATMQHPLAYVLMYGSGDLRGGGRLRFLYKLMTPGAPIRPEGIALAVHTCELSTTTKAAMARQRSGPSVKGDYSGPSDGQEAIDRALDLAQAQLGSDGALPLAYVALRLHDGGDNSLVFGGAEQAPIEPLWELFRRQVTTGILGL